MKLKILRWSFTLICYRSLLYLINELLIIMSFNMLFRFFINQLHLLFTNWLIVNLLHSCIINILLFQFQWSFQYLSILNISWLNLYFELITRIIIIWIDSLMLNCLLYCLEFDSTIIHFLICFAFLNIFRSLSCFISLMIRSSELFMRWFLILGFELTFNRHTLKIVYCFKLCSGWRDLLILLFQVN